MSLDTSAIKAKYVIVMYENGAQFISPIKDLDGFLEGELSGLDEAKPETTVSFRLVDMTDEQYAKLPEFVGP